MADDKWESTETLNFDVITEPKGNTYYNLDILSTNQQEILNTTKIKTIRNDENYLNNHPEIRAIIFLIVNHILSLRPRNDLHKVIAMYFQRPLSEINEDVKDCLKKMKRQDEEKIDFESSIEDYLINTSLEREEIGNEESLENYSNESSEGSVLYRYLNSVLTNASSRVERQGTKVYFDIGDQSSYSTLLEAFDYKIDGE